MNPNEWAEQYAVYRAVDMKINGGKLSDKYWRIIGFLRESYRKTNRIPMLFETREANEVKIS